MDWRIFLNPSLTTVWLITGFIYVSSSVGWFSFVSLPVEEVGSFLRVPSHLLRFCGSSSATFYNSRNFFRTRRLYARPSRQRSPEPPSRQSFNLKSWRPVRPMRDRRQPCALPRHNCAINWGALSGMLYRLVTGSLGDYPSGEIDSEQMFSEQSKGDQRDIQSSTAGSFVCAERNRQTV